MAKLLPFAAAAVFCAAGSLASAGVLFDEPFSTDGPISDYVGPGKVFSVATGAEMPGVADGKLTFGFTANVGADSLGTVVSSLGGAHELLSVTFQLTPVSYSAGSLRVVIGNTTDLAWVGWDPSVRSWANFYVSSSGISIQGGANVPFAMGAEHAMSIFLNNSGSPQTYTGPDGSTTYALADGTWSLFDGTTPLAENVARGGVSSISHAGLLAARNWGGAQTLSEIDNWMIRNDLDAYPIPEPTALAFLGLGGMAFLARRRTRGERAA